MPRLRGSCNIPFRVGDGAGNGRRITTARAPPRTAPRAHRPSLDHGRPTRGNYDSGEDFVLEYGELRFTFNERDFAERCEQAARKLGFVGGTLDDGELEDL